MSNTSHAIECFPNTYDPYHARKLGGKPRSYLVFYCDACNDAIYDYELETFYYYKTPDGARICYACVECMTVEEALKLLGCRKI